MRIAQVVSYSHKSFGGHEYNLSKALSEMGHDVTLFTSNRIPPRYGKKKVTSDDPEQFRIARFSPFVDLKEEVPLVPFLLPSLCRNEFDVIHVHEYFQFCSFYGVLASKLKHSSLILTQHGYYYPEKLIREQE